MSDSQLKIGMGSLERHYPDEGSVCQEQQSPEWTTKRILGLCLKLLEEKSLIPLLLKYGKFIYLFL